MTARTPRKNPRAQAKRPRAAARRRKPHGAKLDLALQGGGSHGAFTWGVLDALLEDGSLAFDGVSGTSAGALNAAVLACGLSEGGRDGARRALSAFWRDLATCGGPFSAGTGGALGGFNLDQNPWFAWLNAWQRQWSPYQFNPGNRDLLRELLGRHISEPVLRSGALRLFVTATSVRTGQPQVFSGERLSIDALLASACLPQLFQAITIAGEPYWDGGYVGNPALWPLIYETEALDILLVQLDPLVREGTPTSAIEIADRINEITFNASLSAEMRAIAFVKKLIKAHRINAGHYKDLRLHRIADDLALAPLDASSKYNTDLHLIEQLFGIGRAAAQRWLAQHRAAVGVESSFDFETVFLKPRE